MFANSSKEGRLKVAAVQMDANPAPTVERLERAGRLVEEAADSGAQLVLLPECFNTGYTFNEEHHNRVEKMDGQTAIWLADTATRLNIHLAGSFMMLEQGETYNTLLLLAPDGRSWRYDKNYPWGWERGFFRRSRLEAKITVADTDLGDIGMLICWDVSHLNLWEMYAGKVDLMLISSCPVDVGHAIYQLPSGEHFTLNDMGPRFISSADTVLLTFTDMIDQQTAWLGVPAVHAVECGHIQTEIPMGRRAMMGWIFTAPWMIKYLPQANDLQMCCDLVHECKILDKEGKVLSRLSEKDGEAFTMAEVNLDLSKTTPQEPQPETPVPKESYFIADVFLPRINKAVYRKGQRLWRSN